MIHDFLLYWTCGGSVWRAATYEAMHNPIRLGIFCPLAFV